MTELVNIRSARKPERVEDYPFDSSVPYINIQALETETPNKFAGESSFIIGEKDLVIVKDGYRSGKVFFAQEGIAASTLAILSPMNNNVRMDYLYCYLSYCYDEFQNRLRGTAIGHLDMNFLKQLTIPLPDLTTQGKIAEKYQSIEKLANELKGQSQRLKDLSIKLGNNELKNNSDKLTEQVELMLKSWLHELFKKIV